MTQLRQRVERLETAATTSTQYGATSNDLANFPGMMNLVAGSGVSFTPGTGTLTITATGGGGTVTSVGMSVPSFLSVSGSPVTTSGTLAVTYSGTALPIANGGSGQTTANAALNAFLPSQATHAGKHLQTDGANTSWATPTAGTVTSVNATGADGITVSGVPFTTSGTIAIKTENINQGIFGRKDPSVGVQEYIDTGGTVGYVLRVDAIGTLAFGTIDGTSIENASVPVTKLADGSACSVLGRSANSIGAYADISIGANDRLLGRVSNVVQSTQLTAGMVPNALITSAMLRDSAACSLIGRSANSSGVPADISMGTNDRLLGRVSNVVQSTQLTAGMVPNALVTSAMLRNSAGLSVIGRSAASSGVVADITAGGARNFLKSSAAATALTFDVLEKEDFPGGDWIGATNGTDYAAASTSIAADATWYDTGASVSLAAGTYLINYYAQGFLRTSSGSSFITTRLYNVTDTAAVTSSEMGIIGDSGATRRYGEGARSIILTVAGTKTIRMEASRLAGATYIATSIIDDTNGRSGITYVRIA